MVDEMAVRAQHDAALHLGEDPMLRPAVADRDAEHELLLLRIAVVKLQALRRSFTAALAGLR